LGGGGLLDGVNDFIQSLQDGLTLAQAAFPANVRVNERAGPGGSRGFHLRIAAPSRNVNAPAELAFSRDEEQQQQEDDVEEGGREEVGEEQGSSRNSLQVGSFVQQQQDRQAKGWMEASCGV
jgi:hypothetical protein